MPANALLWAGLILFAILVLRLFRTGVKIKARDISGIVVAGDVHGEIKQTQSKGSEKAPTALKEALSMINIILGIIAAILVIVSVVVQ